MPNTPESASAVVRRATRLSLLNERLRRQVNAASLGLTSSLIVSTTTSAPQSFPNTRTNSSRQSPRRSDERRLNRSPPLRSTNHATSTYHSDGLPELWDQMEDRIGYDSSVATILPGDRQPSHDWTPTASSVLATPSLAGTISSNPSLVIANSQEASTQSFNHLQSFIRREYLPRAPSPPASSLPSEVQPATAPSASRLRSLRFSNRNPLLNTHPGNRPLPANTFERWELTREEQVAIDNLRTSRVSNARINTHLPASRPVEEAIKYLTKLQYTPLELTAPQNEFLGKRFPLDDFLIDTRILKIPETSWLNIGGVFSGSQYAAPIPLTQQQQLQQQQHEQQHEQQIHNQQLQQVIASGQTSTSSRNSRQGRFCYT